MSRKEILFLIGILSLGVLLRFTDLTVPDFTTDEAQFAMGSRAHPVAGMFLFFLSQLLFGSTLLSVRGVSAVAGILTIAVLFLFARKYAGVPAAFLTAAIAGIWTSAVVVGRLAYLDSLLCLFWSLLLLAFLHAREREDVVTVTAVFVTAALSVLTKTQGFLLPGFLLLGLIIERRQQVFRSPAAWALVLSHAALPLFLAAHPEVFQVLVVYRGFVGFVHQTDRIREIVFLWGSLLGPFAVLALASIPMIRRISWPYGISLFLAILLSLLVSARLYYTAYTIFFAFPCALLLLRFRPPLRGAFLVILLVFSVFRTGPQSLMPHRFLHPIYREAGYWNTHAVAVNAAIGDAKEVIALGHVGHQIRWYIDVPVLKGASMDWQGKTATVLVAEPYEGIEPPGTMRYHDEAVRVIAP